ncbi:electron transport complex subunit E [Beggiatoa leptomitoformis]|uniref:Ion-translocating oxidoreductase complex subunit E n=1 Tax=Beggiatoa leptomitoformis TaxID=288004 RepID=A0A2N9YAZ9_9GAMM|nr:electron transport complex subunit E [Beggiatoa leptomitoformis]ALG66984.1 RnfABCDGE type electron transport complex subunit E [Beggiatoa leptomitoformis]AUI67645.1 RnfABCDGE type electron transport complex subunit E [Beggiatoa leptomitoformis]
MTTEYRDIIYDGLWKNNTSLVQLLGLCPLLATTGTLINGLGLGIATTLILIATNATVSLIRHIVPNEVRIPIFVLIIAAFVTAVELLIKAFYYDLYLVLGIFIPLIVTNCFVIGRAEAFASRHSVDKAMLDGLMMGLGFTFALVLLGGLRELLGHGTLFAQAEIMFGEFGKTMTLTIFENYKGFLIAILPPGAFFGLALLVVLKNMIDQRLNKRVVKVTTTQEKTVLTAS